MLSVLEMVLRTRTMQAEPRVAMMAGNSLALHEVTGIQSSGNHTAIGYTMIFSIAMRTMK